MTLNEVRKLCDEKAHVPLWPDAGRALGLGRWSSYDQAKQGKIETIGIGYRKRVPTSWLRKKLGTPVIVFKGRIQNVSLYVQRRQQRQAGEIRIFVELTLAAACHSSKGTPQTCPSKTRPSMRR